MKSNLKLSGSGVVPCGAPKRLSALKYSADYISFFVILDRSKYSE